MTAASDAHCEQNAITETSQRGLGYQSGEPAGAVNSGSAPANAATTPRVKHLACGCLVAWENGRWVTLVRCVER